MYKEIMCNFDNIYEAYKKSHKGKTNTPDVIEFDKNKLYNLNKILQHLEKKEWNKLFVYYRFMIRTPKERVVDAMRFEGRIVQHILCDKVLQPYFEKRLIHTNAACRKNKGTDFALKKTKEYLVDFLKHHSDGYVLKMDIKKYFPSIDKTTLKNMLSDFPDEEIKELLYFIIDTTPETNGIPIGNQTSQWFALYYLNAIDRAIKERFRIKYYVRYMDDLIIIHHNKQCLIWLLKLLINIANKLKLKFNDKTQLFPLHKGFSFLCWRYLIFGNRIINKLSRVKKKQRIAKLKEIEKLLLKGKDTIKQHYEKLHALYKNLIKGFTHAFVLKYKLYSYKIIPSIIF